MLGDDSYVPFPYFYDVTSRSLPLLFNVRAGRSGAVLQPSSRMTAAMAEPDAPEPPVEAPAVGLLLTDDGTSAYESEGWMRWLLDHRWRIDYRSLTPNDIAESGLAPLDVLVVPNGDARAAAADLGTRGRIALREWLADGGRYIGMRGGTELAARLQLTTTRLETPRSDVPGSQIRARVRRGPLSEGVGRSVWSFYEYDNVMTVNDPSRVAVAYPAAHSRRFFVSGYERGAEELGRTAAVVDESYADGRIVVFAGEPNFRAYTDGTQQLLWDAMMGDDPRRRPQPAGVGTDRVVADRAAGRLTSLDGRLLVTVRAGAADRAAAMLAGRGLRTSSQPLGNGLERLVVLHHLTEDGAVLRDVVRRLRALGDEVVALRVP